MGISSNSSSTRNVNDRTDRYGGSLENRVRFGREVLQTVRNATSESFLVGFRMTADQGLPSGGMSTAELEDVARAITAGGTVDLLSISNGTGYTARTTAAFVPGDEMPINMNGAHGGRMRKVTGVPVLVAGRILDAATAEHAIAVDGVDLVAMTRAVIADPDLPRKYAAGTTPDPASASTRAASAACTRADPCGARSIRESVTLRSTPQASDLRVLAALW